ncbi:MAG: CPBP family intramembrane metalloprotease [Rhizobacter sp.]|nr:CPBP family intramembrane metalloprotease [Rhizobacter sp.]
MAAASTCGPGLRVRFNTVLGEELLFRGLLLPRMNRAFGKTDWSVNGVLFALYHLHMPWVIPAAVLDSLWFAWPSKYYRSTWIGIVVHSTAQRGDTGVAVAACVAAARLGAGGPRVASGWRHAGY